MVDMTIVEQNIEKELNLTQETNVKSFIGKHILEALDIDSNYVKIDMNPFSKKVGVHVDVDGTLISLNVQLKDELYTKLQAKFKF